MGQHAGKQSLGWLLGAMVSALPCQSFAQGAPPLPSPQPLTAPQAPAAPQAPGQPNGGPPTYAPPASQSAPPNAQSGPSFIPEPPPNYDDGPGDSADGYAGQPVRPDQQGYEDEVATEQAPPPPIEEPVPLAPAPSYVWAPGYWYWVGYQYSWVPGRWLTPHPGYFYVGPRWNYVGSRWAFRVGRLVGITRRPNRVSSVSPQLGRVWLPATWLLRAVGSILRPASACLWPALQRSSVCLPALRRTAGARGPALRLAPLLRASLRFTALLGASRSTIAGVRGTAP
jgi:hypothetical protein